MIRKLNMKLSTWSKIFLLMLAVLGDSDAQHCADGWTAYADMCYHFSHDMEEWVNAEALCEHYGANLAEIHSQSVDNFLIQEVKRRNAHFWIGANDLMVENEWRWYKSDTKLDYAHWGSLQPDNTHGNENCVEIRGDAWNDYPCTLQNFYICEKNSQSSVEVIGR